MLGVIAGAAGLATAASIYGAVAPNSSLFGEVIGRGPSDRSLYLTFDDGPNPSWTPRILDILYQRDVPAAFFMVGQFAASQPSIVRAVSDAGHVIGNHTWTHQKLHLRSRSFIRDELGRTHHTLTDIVHDAPKAFRAPHGYRNPFVTSVTKSMGYATFGWTLGVWDTARPGHTVIRQRMRAKLRPGAILLLHDGDGYNAIGDREQTVDALPGIIRDARADGYEFRSLSELLPL